MAMMPPVEVPVIRSKCSTILRPVTFSNVASTAAVNAPMMPPPSRLRMRNRFIGMINPKKYRPLCRASDRSARRASASKTD